MGGEKAAFVGWDPLGHPVETRRLGDTADKPARLRSRLERGAMAACLCRAARRSGWSKEVCVERCPGRCAPAVGADFVAVAKRLAPLDRASGLSATCRRPEDNERGGEEAEHEASNLHPAAV